jgi:hypothetical protein
MSKGNDKSLNEKITAIMQKIFSFGKSIVHLISEFIHNTFNLTTFAIKTLLEVLATADAVVFVAAAIFAGVMIAAGYQWSAIGVWAAKALGLGGVLVGIGAGTLGILAGIGFNVYQLFPSLWRVKKKIAKAYVNKNIDPKAKDLPEGVSERLMNWHTFSHRTLERGRYLSYLVETAIQLVFWATVLSLSFQGMLMLIVTLVLPEVTISLLSAACDIAEAIHEGHQQAKGGQSSRGGGEPRREAPTVDISARKM